MPHSGVPSAALEDYHAAARWLPSLPVGGTHRPWSDAGSKPGRSNAAPSLSPHWWDNCTVDIGDEHVGGGGADPSLAVQLGAVLGAGGHRQNGAGMGCGPPSRTKAQRSPISQIRHHLRMALPVSTAPMPIPPAVPTSRCRGLARQPTHPPPRPPNSGTRRPRLEKAGRIARPREVPQSAGPRRPVSHAQYSRWPFQIRERHQNLPYSPIRFAVRRSTSCWVMPRSRRESASPPSSFCWTYRWGWMSSSVQSFGRGSIRPLDAPLSLPCWPPTASG